MLALLSCIIISVSMDYQIPYGTSSTNIPFLCAVALSFRIVLPEMLVPPFCSSEAEAVYRRDCRVDVTERLEGEVNQPQNCHVEIPR